MAARGRPSVRDREIEDEKALGPDRVPENQKREVYERVRRAIDAKSGGFTNHKVGSSPWDKHEQKVLEDGLRYYPHERHSNMLIYIRIAASLPRKTVRDVAHHLRHMQDAHRAKLDAAAGMHPAKRHQPDPAAAAAMAAMHDHRMAAFFAANVAGMAPMHTLPGLAQGLAGPGGPGPHLKDEKVEARVCTLLQENMAMINSIHENIVMGRFFDNHSLMISFDKNVKEVTALLATLPFAEMQKLPVQINPYFISGSLPPGLGPPQPGSPTHHPHAQPGIPGGVGGGVPNHRSGNGAIGAASSGVDTSAPAGAAPAVGGSPPQPQPPTQPQQQQQQPQAEASLFVPPPAVTPAAQAQAPEPQLVPEASAKAAAAGSPAAAGAAAATPAKADLPVAVANAEAEAGANTASAQAAGGGFVAPVAALSELRAEAGVSEKEPPAEGSQVAPPGA